MAKLTAAQIARYAYDAGLRDTGRLTRAVAIALGESGGNTDAVGDVALQNGTWGPSVGLWQVRSLNAERGKGTTRDETKLRDPAFNARAMMSISGNGSNWNPWTVNNTGAYLLHMPAAQAGVKSMGSAVSTLPAKSPIDDFGEGVVEGFTDPLGVNDQIADAVQPFAAGMDAIYGWISDRQNWIRVAQVLIGGVVIVAGVAYISKGTIADVAVKTITKGLK